MNRAWLVAGLLIVVSGCGGDSKPPIFNGGKKPKDSGPVEEVDAAVSVDSGAESGTGPVLEFVAPAAARDPVADTVITTRDVTVRCKATKRPGGAEVDASKVVITLEKGMTTVTAPVTSEGDEHIAKFDVGDFPNGRLRFHCDAKDSGSPVQSSSIQLDTLLDLGPTIEIIEPKEKDVKALNTETGIQFRVTPAPLAESGDSEADVKDVLLRISGVTIPISEVAGDPGLYKTTVDFKDKALFDVTPSDAEVLVTARSARSPEAPTRSARVSFLVDGQDPSISVVSPLNNALVRGEVTLVLNITDPAGIKPDTIRAEITSPAIVLHDWKSLGNNRYSHSFDTSKFPFDVIQIYIQIFASDLVGNEQSTSHTLYIDDMAPVLSLDPPLIRERKKSGDKWFCSELFDPVGSDAISDGDKWQGTQSMYRVLVEDHARIGDGANVGFYATINPDSVKLYARKNLNKPILIDTNGDGTCDEVNLSDSDTKTLVLKPLDSKGSSWFSRTVDLTGISSSTCTADPAGQLMAPLPICEPGTQMTRVVYGRNADKPRAVYAYSPTNTATGACEGLPWEVSNAVDVQGAEWVCVTARAEDMKVNVGVAEPIRVCLSESGADCAGPAPDCHVGCQIRDWQRFEPNAIWTLR
ncbi:MAG TPA: hypothetical protein VJR89_40380 [Polyangiales bacterium]|nr:hypothetical protein [Polyangiales bacterium]